MTRWQKLTRGWSTRRSPATGRTARTGTGPAMTSTTSGTRACYTPRGRRTGRRSCRRFRAGALVEGHLDPSRQEEIAGRLAETFRTRTRDEWVEDLAALETCVAPVNDVAEGLEDPQVSHRGGLATAGGSPLGPGPAIRVSDHVPEIRPAPAL